MTGPAALVAEDEAPQRRTLCELLRELWPELQIVAECDEGLAALEALNTLRPQIAFLDIRMPGVSGLEVARAASSQAHVIFTTAYDEYAVTAFDEGVIDYLLKPIRRERLARTIERLKQRIDTVAPPGIDTLIDALQDRLGSRSPARTIRWITGNTGRVTKMFAIDEVLFFQAQDKYVRVVTATDELQIRQPLRELVASLDPEMFWQVHRSVIVSARAIRKVEPDSDGRLMLHVKGRPDLLPISNAFQHRFKPM
jgi:DNA-binding LytR/AlgR family response regulator